jgi:uncharacterized membrane protein YqjE
MDDNNNHPPTLITLARRVGRTGLGLLQNRGELLLLELQEEKGRAIGLLIAAFGLFFAAMMAVLLITATVIFIVPEAARIYVAGGFALLYVVGAVFAYIAIKSGLKRVPFGQTLTELRKDRAWLETLE